MYRFLFQSSHPDEFLKSLKPQVASVELSETCLISSTSGKPEFNPLPAPPVTLPILLCTKIIEDTISPCYSMQIDTVDFSFSHGPFQWFSLCLKIIPATSQLHSYSSTVI